MCYGSLVHFVTLPIGSVVSKMTIVDARQYVGKNCAVTYRDRLGVEHNKDLHIENLTFVPLYGAYLVGDAEDVCLDKVTAISLLD